MDLRAPERWWGHLLAGDFDRRLPHPLPKLVLFVQLLAQKARRDAIQAWSASLAFVTILSLVPLLAAFSFIGTQFFQRFPQERLLEALSQFLPYSEEALMIGLQNALAQAESIRHVGAMAFLVITFGALNAIENAINRIWEVEARRSLRTRILSLTLLIFWGPIVLGLTFSGLVLLRHRPWLESFIDTALAVQVLPALVTAAGLTMLYQMVPATRVRFAPAAQAGLGAALALDVLRRTFGLLTLSFRQWGTVVYGSFALLFLFMISIQLVWAIVLAGSSATYVLQHFGSLSRRGPARLRLRHWLGVAAAFYLTERFLQADPIVELEDISLRLAQPPHLVRSALAPLVKARLLREAPGDEEAFLLAGDPHRTTVADLLEAYDRGIEAMLEPIGPDLAEPVAACTRELDRGRREVLSARSLVDWVDPEHALSTRPAD